MTAEVKGEIFGSRPSRIEPLLKSSGISYVKNIFLLTCRARFNRDKKTRYLIVKEFTSPNSLEGVASTLDQISLYVKEYLQDRIVGIHINGEREVTLFQRGEAPVKMTYSSLKDYLLSRVNCRYEPSYAKGSKRATPLSRFFREELGKSVSITDIDFFIPELGVFLEEKDYVDREFERVYGLLGWGQCLSYRELLCDVIKGASFLLLFLDREFLYFKKLRETLSCNDRISHGKWGNMVKLEPDGRVLLQEFPHILLSGGF